MASVPEQCWHLRRASAEMPAQEVGGKVMIERAEGHQLVITVFRLIPKQRSDWTPNKRCRIRTGWYADKRGEPTFISEQLGEVLSWSYFDCVGEEPRAIEMHVRVRQELKERQQRKKHCQAGPNAAGCIATDTAGRYRNGSRP
jgi:hypothetical protein